MNTVNSGGSNLGAGYPANNRTDSTPYCVAYARLDRSNLCTDLS
ncbi:hypothetical protein QD460_04405 [Rhizobium jaguaris]